MRASPLVVLLAALAACAPEPTGVPAGTSPVAAEAGGAAPPPPPVRIDSLVWEEPDLRYTVRIGYPRLLLDGAAAARVNGAIRDSVAAFADAFRPAEPPPDYDAPAFAVTVEGGPRGAVYQDDDVLSALVEVYAYTGGAHGNLFFLPLTYHLGTGEALRLGDLFETGGAFGDTLAAWTERGALRHLAAGLGTTPDEARASFFADGLGPIREGDVFFTLGSDSLHVHVPPYQLSAYAAGAFHVGVPYRALAPFARPSTLPARRAARGRPPE